MILGGGGVGESKKSTRAHGHRRPEEGQPGVRADGPTSAGHPLSEHVLLPDDTVFTTGGSADYRGRGGTQHPQGAVLRPEGATRFRAAADPKVGRNYHSEALLLPDGRIMTFGSDPLYDDSGNTKPGSSSSGSRSSRRRTCTERQAGPHWGRPAGNRPHGRATFATSHPERVSKARLMRPSAVTHMTDVEQRSIDLPLKQGRHLGDDRRTERPDARAARLVHAVRDRHDGDAVGGEVDPGAMKWRAGSGPRGGRARPKGETGADHDMTGR